MLDNPIVMYIKYLNGNMNTICNTLIDFLISKNCDGFSEDKKEDMINSCSNPLNKMHLHLEEINKLHEEILKILDRDEIRDNRDDKINDILN